MWTRNLELERAIVAAPADYERLAVYGDWLAQRGDPRGPLMVIGAELLACDPNEAAHRPRIHELYRAEAALWREHRGAIEGELAELVRHGLVLRWRAGCVQGATLTVPPDDTGARTLATLLAHPAAFALEVLDLRTASLGEHGFHYQPLVDMVAEGAPTTLRGLSLGELDGWTADETVILGDLRPLFGRHTALRRVTLAGRPSTVSAPWALPELQALGLRPVGLSRTWLRVITAEVWPSLRRLEFSYASAMDDDVSWLCSSRLTQRFPALLELALPDCSDPMGVIDALAATGLGRQLVELDLRGGRVDRAAVERLRESREDFPTLRRLLLDRRPYRDRGGLDEVSRTLDWLSVTSAGEPD